MRAKLAAAPILPIRAARGCSCFNRIRHLGIVPELAIVRRDNHLSFSTPAILKKALTTGRNGLTKFAPVRIFAIAYASPRLGCEGRRSRRALALDPAPGTRQLRFSSTPRNCSAHRTRLRGTPGRTRTALTSRGAIGAAWTLRVLQKKDI